MKQYSSYFLELLPVSDPNLFNYTTKVAICNQMTASQVITIKFSYGCLPSRGWKKL